MNILRRTLLAAATLAALPALADPPAPGCWAGAVKKEDGKTTAYTAQLWLAGERDRPVGKLHFGSPKSCQLVATYKDDTAFSLTRPNGGFCQTDLFDKTLTVTPGEGGLAFSIDGQPVKGLFKLHPDATTEATCLTQ